MVKECIHQSALRVARSRVNNQAGALVDHQEVLVLENDIKGDILGFSIQRFGGRNLHQYHLARRDRL